MGTKDTATFDGDGGLSLGASYVSCSICLEAVTDNGDKSRAKLQCGHEFHLDCIGSAFNAKGMMQCPNCRKIEKGQWLYANGFHSIPEFSMDNWTQNEDLNDLSYSEMPLGIHWCPFSGLTQLPSAFEDGESRSTAYHDLLGHHIFAEQTAASSAVHPCPYVAYFQPLLPSSSNSGGNVADNSNFNHPWNGLSGPSEILTSNAFSAMDLHYHIWDHHFPSFSRTSSHSGGSDQALVPSATHRSTRGDSDTVPRSGSFVHPFLLGHGAGSSVVSSMFPPYPGSSARSHDRVQGLHAYHQQQQQPSNSPGTQIPIFSGLRRSSGQRGLTPVGPVVSSSDHSGGFSVFPLLGSSGQNLQEVENPLQSHFYAWENDRFATFPFFPVDRESGWGPSHQVVGVSDSGSRSSSFWQNARI